jgi:hypothetical protein
MVKYVSISVMVLLLTTAAYADIRTAVQEAQEACFRILEGDPRLPKGRDGANSPAKVAAFNVCMNNIKMMLEQRELVERLERLKN